MDQRTNQRTYVPASRDAIAASYKMIGFFFILDDAMKQNVRFEDGIAGASHEQPGYAAHNAFPPRPPGQPVAWHSTAKSIEHHPSIWYDFRSRRIYPAEVSFVKNGENGRPTHSQFIGTNDRVCDANSDWDILCELRSERESQKCKVNRDILARN